MSKSQLFFFLRMFLNSIRTFFFFLLIHSDDSFRSDVWSMLGRQGSERCWAWLRGRHSRVETSCGRQWAAVPGVGKLWAGLGWFRGRQFPRKDNLWAAEHQKNGNTSRRSQLTQSKASCAMPSSVPPSGYYYTVRIT